MKLFKQFLHHEEMQTMSKTEMMLISKDRP